MRISDWSSDVCSSYLLSIAIFASPISFTISSAAVSFLLDANRMLGQAEFWPAATAPYTTEIGRASGRERVCQYVSISVVAVFLKNKKKETRRNNGRVTKYN